MTEIEFKFFEENMNLTLQAPGFVACSQVYSVFRQGDIHPNIWYISFLSLFQSLKLEKLDLLLLSV